MPRDAWELWAVHDVCMLPRAPLFLSLPLSLHSTVVARHCPVMASSPSSSSSSSSSPDATEPEPPHGVSETTAAFTTLAAASDPDPTSPQQQQQPSSDQSWEWVDLGECM